MTLNNELPYMPRNKKVFNHYQGLASAILVILSFCLIIVVISCAQEHSPSLITPVPVARAQDTENQLFAPPADSTIAHDAGSVKFPAGIRAHIDLYSGTGDGYVRNTGSSWEAARDTASDMLPITPRATIDTPEFNYTSHTITVGTARAESTSFEISRAFIPIDSSAIPDNAHITGASLNLFISAAVAHPQLRIVRSSQGNTSYVLKHDYNKCRYNDQDEPPKKLADDLLITSLNAYQSFPLNLNGLAWVSKRNWTTFGIREALFDAGNTVPPTTTNTSLTFSTSDHPVADYHPYISVTLTIPEYVIESDRDDTCEKNKQEQYLSGYVRTKKVAINTGSPEAFSVREGSALSNSNKTQWQNSKDPTQLRDKASSGPGGSTGESWKAYLFPLAPAEGSGKIDGVTVYYNPGQIDEGSLGKMCIAIGKRDPSIQPDLPYHLIPSSTYSYSWPKNPYTEKPWNWYDISTMHIGVVLNNDRARKTRSPIPQELHAIITIKNLVLGSDAENNTYDLGLRFNLVGVSPGDTCKYARLILAANEFDLTKHDQLKLGITGHNAAATSDFSSARPSRKQPVTSNSTDWYIDEGDLPGDMRGIHITQCILPSPNIAPLINEIAGRAQWGLDSDSKYVALTIAGNNFTPFTDNLIYLPDFDGGPLYNPIALELYTSVYDCFIAREAVARVTDTSALIHCISLLPLDFFVEFKVAGTSRWDTTPLLTGTTPGAPIEVILSDLSPAREYEYRVVYRETGGGTFSRGTIHSFHTQRADGEAFTFTIESDTHVRYSEEAVALQESTRQLQMKDLSWDTIEKEGTDFHINLGDWFEGRVGHCITETTAVYDYIKTKAYQGDRCWPTYFVLGNHEGENPSQDTYHRNARSARKKVLPNPDDSVSSFYKNPNPYESYYAWEWGDALFIVLDLYSYCSEDPDKDPWNWTLGKAQYDWLYTTLSSSRKKWKFVFLHQLLGGKREVRNYGRGGIEYAKFKVKQNATYEWGGEDEQGNYIWSQKRPGWKHGAIHDMLVSEGVTAVFHGHDHGFAHQILDDIHYIECPTISGIGMFQKLYDDGFLKASDYENGKRMGNNGYLRVTVNPEKVLLEYIGTIRDVDEEVQGYKNGESRYAAVLEKHDG